jgi:CubicO group peptidase (beta-lactamase class C family)
MFELNHGPSAIPAGNSPAHIKMSGINKRNSLYVAKPIIALAAIISLLHAPLFAQRIPKRPRNDTSHRLALAAAESVGMSGERLAKIDEAVLASIERKETPGAAVLVGRQGRIVYRKAFGDRAVSPKRETLTVDTIFDLASLTKVVATATSIMILIERGKVSLADPVSLYIPEFGKNGKERITLEQLMTHRAGLMPDNEIADYVGVTIDPLKMINELQPSYEPGSRFVYSDVGYIVAAEIVRRVSGKRIDEFARENIFAPLGMKDTGWGPGAGGQGSDVLTPEHGDRKMQGKESNDTSLSRGGGAAPPPPPPRPPAPATLCADRNPRRPHDARRSSRPALL